VSPIIHPIKTNTEKISSWTKFYWKMCLDLFGIWSLRDLIPYNLRAFYYDKVRPIFAPHHSRIRKAIPRHWNDLTEIIVTVNFEIIKSFYEDEMIDGHVDWDASLPHRKFKKWIEKTYNYITVERPQLLIDLNNAYPEFDEIQLVRKINYDDKGQKITSIENPTQSYEKLYGEVDRIEKLIDKMDIQYITQMIKFKGYFWT
jgi:hypothetical protein